MLPAGEARAGRAGWACRPPRQRTVCTVARTTLELRQLSGGKREITYYSVLAGANGSSRSPDASNLDPNPRPFFLEVAELYVGRAQTARHTPYICTGMKARCHRPELDSGRARPARAERGSARETSLRTGSRRGTIARVSEMDAVIALCDRAMQLLLDWCCQLQPAVGCGGGVSCTSSWGQRLNSSMHAIEEQEQAPAARDFHR